MPDNPPPSQAESTTATISPIRWLFIGLAIFFTVGLVAYISLQQIRKSQTHTQVESVFTELETSLAKLANDFGQPASGLTTSDFHRRQADLYTKAGKELPLGPAEGMLAIADWHNSLGLIFSQFEQAETILNEAGWRDLTTIRGVDGFKSRLELYESYAAKLDNVLINMQQATSQLRSFMQVRKVDPSIREKLIQSTAAAIDGSTAVVAFYQAKTDMVQAHMAYLAFLQNEYTAWRMDPSGQRIIFAEDYEEEAAKHDQLFAAVVQSERQLQQAASP